MKDRRVLLSVVSLCWESLGSVGRHQVSFGDARSPSCTPYTHTPNNRSFLHIKGQIGTRTLRFLITGQFRTERVWPWCQATAGGRSMDRCCWWVPLMGSAKWERRATCTSLYGCLNNNLNSPFLCKIPTASILVVIPKPIIYGWPSVAAQRHVCLAEWLAKGLSQVSLGHACTVMRPL